MPLGTGGVSEQAKIELEAVLIDNISKKLDVIDRGIDDITKKRLARDKAAAQASIDAAKSSGQAWTEFRSMYSTVLDIARVGQQVWQSTIGISQEYSNAVRELSFVTGTSAQETSKLIQVLDDYNISSNDILIATKALTKEGYSPTIETLALLADQYNALETTQQKNEFVLKNLGKGGLQWVEVLKKGSAAIREQGNEVNKALIINQKQVEASKALFLEMDNAKDAADGLGTAIGNYLTPAMEALLHMTTGSTNSLSEWFAELAESRTISIEMSRLLKEQGLVTKNGTTATKEQIEAIRLQATINVRATQATNENTQAEEDNADAKERQKEAVKIASEALEDYKDMLDEVSQANKDAESFLQSYADFMDDYADEHADAVDKVAEAEEKLRRAQAKDYGDGDNSAENRKNAINDAKEALKEAQKGVQDLQATWHEETNKMIYDMVMAKVSVDGLTDAEFKATQDLAVSMGIRTQAQADEAKAAMDKAIAYADGIALQEDVMKEKAATDAELLRLENEKEAAAGDTANVIISGNEMASQTEDFLAQSVDSATLSIIRQGQEAARTASAVASIKYSSSPVKTGGTAAAQTAITTKNAGEKQYAAGGEFVIPMAYGYEGFQLGNHGTASGGETVTITPKGEQNKGGNVYNVNVYNAKPQSGEEAVRTALQKLSYLGVPA